MRKFTEQDLKDTPQDRKKLSKRLKRPLFAFMAEENLQIKQMANLLNLNGWVSVQGKKINGPALSAFFRNAGLYTRGEKAKRSRLGRTQPRAVARQPIQRTAAVANQDSLQEFFAMVEAVRAINAVPMPDKSRAVATAPLWARIRRLVDEALGEAQTEVGAE